MFCSSQEKTLLPLGQFIAVLSDGEHESDRFLGAWVYNLYIGSYTARHA